MATLDDVRQAIAQRLALTSFVADDAIFGPGFEEPVVIASIPYGFRLSDMTTMTVSGVAVPLEMYFALMTPPPHMKARFVRELQNEKAGLPCDASVITSYYLPFACAELDDMVESLLRSLEGFYEAEGKPCRLVFVVACPSGDWDMVVVMANRDSIRALDPTA